MKGVAKVARGEGNVEVIEVPDPAVTPGHVLIQVEAAGICGTDLHIYHDEYPTDPPVILGHEAAGVVAALGKGVTNCQVGDRVTTETYFVVCGECTFCRDGEPNLCYTRKSIGSGVHGAFAKYVLVPAHNIHHLPENVGFEAGALSEPLSCCVHALEMTRLEPGEIAVVSGPGTIGLLMTQVAKAAGSRVVVIGTNADVDRLAVAESLGADLTLNVNRQDTVAAIREMTDGLGADIVFECSGAAPAAQSGLLTVRRGGRYAQVGLFGKPIQWDLEQVCYKEIRVSGSFATVPSSWRKAIRLLGSGQVQTQPLVSDVFPISQWQRAFERFEEKSGLKILLTPED
jgi:L-iditol 2-dehydrogenase